MWKALNNTADFAGGTPIYQWTSNIKNHPQRKGTVFNIEEKSLSSFRASGIPL